MSKPNPGAALSAMRRTTWHYCLQCNKRFAGIAKAKFCSNACRQANKYAKVKAAREAGKT